MATRALRPGLALQLEFCQALREHAHTLAQQPAIRFELCFAGTAIADAAAALPL